MTGNPFLELAMAVRHFNTETIKATLVGAIAKVAKEAAEFDANPSLEEAADLLITTIGAIQLMGFTSDDLLGVALAKMDTNVHHREWIQQPDGSFQHVPKGP